MKASLLIAGALALAVLVAVYIFSSNKRTRAAFERFCPSLKPPPINERKLEEAVILSHQLTNISLGQKIPQLIYQTNEGSHVPKGMYDAMTTVRKINEKEYSYQYYDNHSSRKFIEANFPNTVLETYDTLKPGAYKADLFRYCVLYRNGGVYVDSSMIAKRPLLDLIRKDDTFVSCEDDDYGGVYNAFMACSPGHPVVKRAIDSIVENVKRKYYGKDPLDVTGPYLLAKAFKEVMGQKVEPGKDYGNGVRLLRYNRTEVCTTGGEITDEGGNVFFYTKYPEYSSDRLWYNTKKHYSAMWKEGDVYDE